MDSPEYIAIAEAAQLFPLRNGKYPHISSIRRRILTGCRGVKLRAIKDGSSWFTTVEWIKQFQEECTKQAMPNQVEHPQVRNERHEAAKRRLAEKYGLRVGGSEPAAPIHSNQGKK